MRKGRLGLAVRSLLSVALLGALVYYIGSADILAQMKSVRWQAMALAVVVLASSFLFVTPRWTVILAALGYRIRATALIGSVVVGFLFNQLLPTAVGGDVLRAWRARQLGVPLDIAIHSVIIDRAAGVFVALVGAILLLPFAAPARGQSSLIGIVGAVAIAGVIGCAVLWGLSRSRPLNVPIIGGLQRGLVKAAGSVWHLIANPAAAVVVFVLASVNQFLPVAAIWLFASDLHMPLAPVDIALVTLVSTLAATIPLSVAGWGVREGALVYLFGLYNVPPDAAFAVSVLYGIALTLSAAPGALLLLGGFASPPPKEATS